MFSSNFSRKIIKIFLEDLNCVGGIVAFCEQYQINNKVTLSKNRRKFGVQKLAYTGLFKII